MNAAAYLLDNGASKDKQALFTSEDSYTYEEVINGALQVAGFLEDSAVKRGERIALIADSSYYWVSVYLGTILSGRVSVPLPTNIDQDKLDFILRVTDCGMVFAQDKYVRKYQSILNKAGTLVVDDVDNVRREEFSNLVDFLSITGGWLPEESTIITDFDDRRELAALMFTSGSTGVPRGVMVSHRNIIANTEGIIEYLGLNEHDRMMAVLPFYYCFGTSLLHTHLRAGGSVVADNRFLFPNVILKRMVETQCTGFAGVPSTYQILLRSSNLKKMEFPSLKHVQQAGGKLPDLFIDELRKALPGTKVFTMYGQTEATARLSYLPPEFMDSKLGSVGKGMPGVKLEILTEEGKLAPPGVVGEIVAAGENITLGYWKDPEETSGSFRDGKLYTGDLAKFDEDGFIFIIDRAKDFIKCGGTRTSCKEIEDIIYEFEGVVESAVIGRPDDVLGEAVHLFVVHPLGSAVEEEIRKHCGKKLDWQLAPKKITFLKSLPKNSSGKVDKPVLKSDPRFKTSS